MSDTSKIRFCAQRFLPGAAENTMEAAFKKNPLNAVRYSDMSLADVNAPARLAVYVGKMWKPGRTLRCRFLGGTAFVRSKVKQCAAIWTEYANIKFEFVDSGSSNIRISFKQGEGSWSHVGTNCGFVASDQPTMNFGWFTDSTTDQEFMRTTVHEFGHAIGCIHEHQQPNANIPWNKPVVYDTYERTQGWTKRDVDQQVFSKYSSQFVSSTAFDRYSIMEYPVPPEFTTDGSSIPLNTQLSENDKIFIRRMYPYPSTKLNDYRTGVVNTMSVRSWQRPAVENPIPVDFTPAYNSPPKVLRGLSWLDVGNSDNLRIRCILQDVRKDRMTINMQSWGGTVQFSSGCAWLAPPSSDTDFQYGYFSTEDDHPWNRPQAKTSRNIVFARSYISPPRVAVWLDSLDVANTANCRVKAYATDITRSGFTVHIDAWGDTTLYSSSVCWAAHSADRTDVRSGTYSTEEVRAWNSPRLQNSSTVTFGGVEFPAPPRLFLALSSLDIDHRTNLRIRLSADNVRKTGMDWHIDSWGDTVFYSASASFIAVA